LADTVTPVSAFLSLRDKFSGALLLESADYRGCENSRSFICLNPIAEFKASKHSYEISTPGGTSTVNKIEKPKDALTALENFISSYKLEQPSEISSITNGFFGYSCYDAVQFFEDISLAQKPQPEREIPLLRYALFEFVIAFHHFNNEIFILQNKLSSSVSGKCDVHEIKRVMMKNVFASYPFSVVGTEKENMGDEEHLEMIRKCKEHVARGDVFQIVTSRCFSQEFRGDEFQVYRVLRSINPSPYLFYFDYGSYRLFGSSPEAQIIVGDGKASIYPIAGTYRRSADRADDGKLAESLSADPKENAEHVMLVDLARNDLSKHCHNVHVEVFKEVQFYSHVIHLVSKVTGTLRQEATPLGVLADTFPAGTLTGAPKYRAMELIDKYEKNARGFYGGCIGFINPSGTIYQAIMIRSFHSQNSVLSYQSGAGIVFDSDPKSEVQEVRNKLGALRKAIELACKGDL